MEDYTERQQSMTDVVTNLEKLLVWNLATFFTCILMDFLNQLSLVSNSNK